jgi:hypothetical protein
MASPVDAGRTTSGQPGSTAAQNKVCPLPATIGAGDLLIMTLRSAGADTHTTPAGWTALILNNQADASTANQTTSIFYKLATGGEGANVTVNCTTSLKFATIARRITGAADPAVQPPQLSTIAVATTAISINPTVVTPTGGNKDYLFLWIGAWDGEQTNPPATAPTGYTNVVWANTGTGGVTTGNCQVVGYSRQATVASEDPAALTISAAPSGSSAWVMAIHPGVPQALMAGTPIGTALLEGALTTVIQASAAVTATATVVAELTIIVTPTGPFRWDAVELLQWDAISITWDGAYEIAITLAGTVQGTATLGGTLQVSARLTGGALATATLAGNLINQIQLTGPVGAIAILTGTLQIGARLTATSAATATAIGTVQVGTRFTAEILTTASLAGVLQVGARFTAGALTTATVAGGLTTLEPGAVLAGALIGTATTAGALTTLVRMTGALSGMATVTGGLTTRTHFASAPTATALIAGSLTGVGVALTGSAVATASLVASLQTGMRFQATVSATASLTATLQTGARFQAAAGAMATLAANLSGVAMLQGAMAATGAATGAATTAITAAGAASGSVGLIGALTTQVQYAGVAAGVASLLGALTTVSAADLGAILPTHTARAAVVRRAAPVAYPLHSKRQAAHRQAEPRVRRQSVRVRAMRTTELTRV